MNETFAQCPQTGTTDADCCCMFLTVGYVKITSVEIDFNSLKAHKAQPSYEPEVYDDIDVPSANKR